MKEKIYDRLFENENAFYSSTEIIEEIQQFQKDNFVEDNKNCFLCVDFFNLCLEGLQNNEKRVLCHSFLILDEEEFYPIHNWLIIPFTDFLSSYTTESSSSPNTIEHIVAKYQNRPKAFQNFYNEIAQEVVGQPDLKKIVYIIWVYLRAIAENTFEAGKINSLLIGPSGSGKSHLMHTIQAVLKKNRIDIDVIIVDLQQITPRGYRGPDIDEVLIPLLEGNNRYGIVLFDECDKKLVPDGSYSDNYFAYSVIKELYTIIEKGEIRNCDKSNNSHKTDRNNKTIKTDKLLFLFGGCFDGIRTEKRRKQEDKKHEIGFNTVPDITSDIPQTISKEDLYKVGVSAEFLGRIGSVINFVSLSKDSVKIIADRFAKVLSTSVKYEIILTEKEYEYIHQKYDDSPMGARVIKSVIWSQVSDIALQSEMDDIGDSNKYVIFLDGEDSKLITKEDTALYLETPAYGISSCI